MSVDRNIVIHCDGILGRGCRHGSSYTALTTRIRDAREEAFVYGWRFTHVEFEDTGRMNLDICRACRMV